MSRKMVYVMALAGLFLATKATAGSFDKDTFRTKSGKEVVITFIKHGTLSLTFDKKIIQIDPVSMYADYTTFPNADYILVTHEHADHLDQKAIDALMGKGTLLILNESSRNKIGKGETMKNGDTHKIDDQITIDAVPAYNTTPGKEKFHPQHRDNGYVLTIDGLRIYVAGDTEDIPEMKKLKDIDVAFLPVNQPYTMTVPQAANAARLFNPKVLYPYHYGDTRIGELKEELKDTSVEVRIRDMQ